MADRPAHVQAEMDGMRAVPDTGVEPWVTRLEPPHPVHVARAAGALITVTESLTQTYMVAYTLDDAGLLAAPAPAPAPDGLLKAGWRFGAASPAAPADDEATAERLAAALHDSDSPNSFYKSWASASKSDRATYSALAQCRSCGTEWGEAVTPDDAIATVARYVVARSYGGPAETVVEIDWSDYPEIGEHDWQAVLDRANELVTNLRPDEETYQQAYRLLADQADEELGYR